MGIIEDRLIITFRGDGYRQDCGALAQKAFGLYGSGGGHKSAARMEIPLAILDRHLDVNLSQQNVDRFLIENLKKAQRAKPESLNNGREN